MNSINYRKCIRHFNENHDFFSVKGDGYTLALNVEALQDEDFIFDDEEK